MSVYLYVNQRRTLLGGWPALCSYICIIMCIYIYICIYAHVHVQQLDSLDYRRSHDKKDNSKTCDWIAAKLCRMVVFAEWWHNAQLTAIFHDSPGNLVPACPILDFISIKDAGGGDGESRSYKTCKAPVQLSPPTNQRPTFYRLDVLPATQPTVRALEG